MGPLSRDFLTTISLVGVRKGYMPRGSKLSLEIGVGVNNNAHAQVGMSEVGASSWPDAKFMTIGSLGVAASSVGYLSSLMRIMAWRGIPASHDASPTSSTSSDRQPTTSRREARQIPAFFSS
jgi:hypothetical protein